MAGEKKKKPFIVAEIICEHCGKPNTVKHFKVTTKKAVKGEYVIETIVEKTMRQATIT